MVLKYILQAQNYMILYFLAVNFFYLFILICAFIAIIPRYKKIQSERVELLLTAEGMPSITIIVPAYNEMTNIVFCVQTLLNLSYRNKKIICVNDGSTDDTLEIMKSAFKLTRVHPSHGQKIKTTEVKGYYHSLIHENLIVIDKVNGGKPDSVNAGINATTTDYMLAVDADSLLDGTELNRLLRYSFTQPEIEGFGASVRVGNGCTVELWGITKVDMPKSFLGRIQAVEYLRAFYFGRMGYEYIGGPLIISGAFAMYATHVVKAAGGYETNTLAEDMEMVAKYKKYRYEHKQNPKTGFIPEPACWTEVPEAWRILGKQRTRWQVGTLQIVWMYRKMFFNPKYGVAGMFAYPYFCLTEVLSPIVEVIGYCTMIVTVILGVNAWQYIFFFFTVTIGVTLMFTVSCCLIEAWLFRKYNSFKHLWMMLWYALMENFGYRQMHLFWRLRAYFRIFKKQSPSVKDMKKTGFTGSSLEGLRREK
ncbi:MAG: glycosyltransferase family 2 protein [Chlamydiales bacterium]|nr:glycosyltransferase family 2 protein [Chlamydiales bacterium]